MNLRQSIVINTAALSVFAIITTWLVAFTADLTRDTIVAREKQVLLESLHQLIPPTRHDNSLEDDRIEMIDSLLGSDKPMTIYRARRHGQPVAAIINSIAPSGYSGKIFLLIAINYDGTLAGVRVISHHETPGLGDAIEESKSSWIQQFKQKSLQQPTPDKWKVRRDKGEFDQITSATITSRAVVKAVYTTLEFYQHQRDVIFAKP